MRTHDASSTARNGYLLLNRYEFLIAALLCAVSAVAAAQANGFALLSGDRVVFYGDSITEQQLYTRDIELYALTRFPRSRMQFIMSGVSGDRVSGGGGGPVDQRLPRDVFQYTPTVVTVMLGMNDGFYRPYDEGTLKTFDLGYRHIVEQLQARAPAARIYLLEPTAFDEISRPVKSGGSYNDFLIKMGGSVASIGAEHHLPSTDMNQPMRSALERARSLDPELATLLIADRVHPGPGMHWVMADTVLKSWNAPSEVTKVIIDAQNQQIAASQNTEIADLHHEKNTLTWQQQDTALPLPLPLPSSDPINTLALHASSVIDDLDQEILAVRHLQSGQYELSIDDQHIGEFSADDLGKGINLALLDTPMSEQARRVALRNDGKVALDLQRNHLLRNVPDEANAKLLKAINDALHRADDDQWKTAQPDTHRYQLKRVA